MTVRTPPPRGPSPEAIFRRSVIAHVEALVLGGQAQGRAVRVVARRDHATVDGRLVQVSVRTLQRWRAAYAEGGLAALEPKGRQRTQTSVVLPPALVEFLCDQKTTDPRASVPEILRRARVRGVIASDLPIDRTTVWRACRRLELPTRYRPSKKEGDGRRWAYPHRMQCVLCDGKHFRAGAGRLKRMAYFFLDDATRYGLHVVVGTSENADLFLRGLHELALRRGLMDLLYLDRGPGFKATDVRVVVEEGLGGWLIHGRDRYPQGHGKIERFNRTALDAVLRSLDGAAQVDPHCDALELRLRHFLEHEYNDRPHESLGKDTPRQRFEQGRPLRFPGDADDLYRRFVVREPRKVSGDHVIRHGGKHWEAPRGTRGQWVEVIRHALDGRLYLTHRGHVIELHELDPHVNAIERRGYPGDAQPLASEGVPITAATEAFRRDLRPIVDSDGGFTDPEES